MHQVIRFVMFERKKQDTHTHKKKYYVYISKKHVIRWLIGSHAFIFAYGSVLPLFFSFSWQSPNLDIFDLWSSGLFCKICQCRRWFCSAEIDGHEKKGEFYSGRLSRTRFLPKST